jgi:hypothetical protein
MIVSVAQEKFNKDVRHDSHRPAMPKDRRDSRDGSSAAPAAAPRTTYSGDAPSAPAPNSNILGMLQGIFATYRRTDQCLDLMDQHL